MAADILVKEELKYPTASTPEGHVGPIGVDEWWRVFEATSPRDSRCFVLPRDPNGTMPSYILKDVMARIKTKDAEAARASSSSSSG